jgi:lauroyl/myristoyl acyltransferase
VLRFEPPLRAQDDDDTNEAIRRSTRSYNAALEALILRHPDQWWWVHRRFRRANPRPRGRRHGAAGDAGTPPSRGVS